MVGGSSVGMPCKFPHIYVVMTIPLLGRWYLDPFSFIEEAAVEQKLYKDYLLINKKVSRWFNHWTTEASNYLMLRLR